MDHSALIVRMIDSLIRAKLGAKSELKDVKNDVETGTFTHPCQPIQCLRSLRNPSLQRSLDAMLRKVPGDVLADLTNVTLPQLIKEQDSPSQSHCESVENTLESPLMPLPQCSEPLEQGDTNVSVMNEKSIESGPIAVPTLKTGRVCEHCFCTSTSYWRTSPSGGSLCNSCGVKVMRRTSKKNSDDDEAPPRKRGRPPRNPKLKALARSLPTEFSRTTGGRFAPLKKREKEKVYYSSVVISPPPTPASFRRPSRDHLSESEFEMEEESELSPIHPYPQYQVSPMELDFPMEEEEEEQVPIIIDPFSISSPQGRSKYLKEQIKGLPLPGLAEILCLLYPVVGKEVQHAIDFGHDAEVDMRDLDDLTWTSLCCILTNH